MEQDDDEFLYGDHSTAPTTASTTAPQQAPAPTPAVSAAVVPAVTAVASTPASSAPPQSIPGMTTASGGDTPMNDQDEELEEGEEEEEEVEVEDSDSEVEFVIERKDGSRPEPPPQPSRYNTVRMAPPQPRPSADAQQRPTPQTSTPLPQTSATAHPPTATSKLDLNANPTYNGTPLTKISLDSDTLLPAEKPWRKPGADVTDYFNYGFDEFTWTAYTQKQEGLREEFDPRKMMEQMFMMSSMGMGVPGMDPSAAMDPAMAAMMGGGPGGFSGAGVPPTGPNAGGQDMGMGGMGDPNAMMMGMQGGFDERQGQGGYGMGTGDPRRGMPPQGPNAQMGGYGGYDQSMMQQPPGGPGGGRGGYGGGGGGGGGRARGRRGW